MTMKGIRSAMIAALLVSVLSAPIAAAEDLAAVSERPMLTSTIAPAVARALEHDRTVTPTLSRRFEAQLSSSTTRRTRPVSRANKILAGVAGGFGGMYAGAFVGSKLEPRCRCHDPGLGGMLVGMPIGAIAGAVFGVWLAGR